MILKLINSNDPRLRTKSEPVKTVDKKILKFIQDMKDTLESQSDPEGVGLAASQVGKNIQIFLAKPKDDIKCIINPKIISISKVTNTELKKKTKILEGCLSLPNYYGPLHRSKNVVIEYMNIEGEKITEEFRNFEAQIILHEIDHLNGILFVDRLIEQKAKMYEFNHGDWEEIKL